MTTTVDEQDQVTQEYHPGSGQGHALELKPDLTFINDVAHLGGEAFKKCYQCATCSGTCPISPDIQPFPRKEMVWAMWGLKDRLLQDPDVWLCHQCNDCSAICPREGNPGDILAVIRKFCYQHYAVPGFMGKLFQSPKYLPLLLAVPIVILLAVIGLFGNFQPEGEIIFRNFLPHPFPLDFLFSLAALFAVVSAALSGMQFWNGLKKGPRPPVPDAKGFVSGLMAAIKEIIPHSQFKECEKANPRYYSHLLTFYGFLALFITTSLVFAGLYLFHIETPLHLLNPVKILGNLGALAFLVGTGWMLFDRLTDPEKSGKSTYNDWLFIGLMFGLALTGVLTEVFRLLDIGVLAYPVYFIHLVLILSMMVYFPFSKFAHLLYRVLAITYYHGYTVSASQQISASIPGDVQTSRETDEQASAA